MPIVPTVSGRRPRVRPERRRAERSSARFARGLRALRASAAAVALALLGGVGGAGPGGVGVGAEAADEYEVKAAFLYNFLKFVEWPKESFDGPRDPFVLAVVGEDPFEEILEKTFRGKKVGDRGIELVRWDEPKEVGRCHLLFVAGDAGGLDRVVKGVGDASVLLVGESPRFALRGGAVNFYVERGRVGFEINPAAAKRRDLEVSPKLLKLARIVEEEEAVGP